MGKKKKIDLNALVTFYDPHPGVGGATVPLNGMLKIIADELDGKTMKLGDGIKIIKSVGYGFVEIVEKYQYIMISSKKPVWPPNGPVHSWRLISYRPEVYSPKTPSALAEKKKRVMIFYVIPKTPSALAGKNKKGGKK